jgi:hypothetical protein
MVHHMANSIDGLAENPKQIKRVRYYYTLHGIMGLGHKYSEVPFRSNSGHNVEDAVGECPPGTM